MQMFMNIAIDRKDHGMQVAVPHKSRANVSDESRTTSDCHFIRFAVETLAFNKP